MSIAENIRNGLNTTRIFRKDKMLCVTYDYERFTKWVGEEMRQRDWNQADLARAMGTSRGTVSNVLKEDKRKARSAGPEFLRMVAKAFGYSEEYVFKIAGILADEVTRWKL
jgi:transcriptional regulator with XRE-family HTH domain